MGIDLGTSNSACAVWDSTRGSPKWIRLKDIAPLDGNGSKWGRLVPSVVQLPDPSDTSTKLLPRVGAEALKHLNETTSGTLVRSVKRLLGRKLQDLDPEWIESLPYELTEDDETGELLLKVTPYMIRNDGAEDTSNNRPDDLFVTPVQVVAILLRGMREAAQLYLDKYAVKKHLEVPGGQNNQVRNVVLGVPAHYSKRHLALVEEAAKLAGFAGKVSTCMESTAAAIAYGHSLQETSKDATIMVIDMGGGTSDITIASKKKKEERGPLHETIIIGPDGEEVGEETADQIENDHASYKVLVTVGEERLGGDDIDDTIMHYVLKDIDKQASDLTSETIRVLVAACRTAKEKLCALDGLPSHSETITVKGSPDLKCTLSQETFEELLDEWLKKAHDLIIRAMENLKTVSKGSTISEVVLVGGTTRIPAIRKMIQTDFFPSLELSTSLNPMSSVAQGLAIQAALISKDIPIHQLRSALMLDCVPHAIGVLQHNPTDGSEKFVEIIRRNQPLPAKGFVTFSLADKEQRGVTIHAVESIGEDASRRRSVYEPVSKEPFNFLLRRLTKEQFERMESRSIQVGMKVEQDGKFIVSIFDENDPEQVRKKERYEASQASGSQEVGELGYITDMVMAESGVSTEQFLLIGTLVGVLALYIAVKLAFHDEEALLIDSD